LLYISTGNRTNSYTAHKVLRCAAAPDGGMFMPMTLPRQDDISLAAFETMNVGESFATVLNLFFGTNLTGWDVDFAVGRQALDLVSAGYKVSLAESWHNPAGKHEYLVQRLYNLVTRDAHSHVMPNLWFRTAVDIAILFALYAKYCRQEIYEFDIAVETANLQQLLAVRYAQKLGLPIQKVILGCIDGDGLWEFLSFGNYQTGRKERIPCIEGLLWLEFGYAEVARYCDAVEHKAQYKLPELLLPQFRKNLFATVVGNDRVKSVIDSTLRTNNYKMEDSTARAFGALQDYRAKKGNNKNTLLFAQNAPER